MKSEQRVYAAEELPVDPKLAEAMLQGFDALLGGRTSATRAHAWRHVKSFAAFLHAKGCKAPIDGEIAAEFKAHVQSLGYSQNYASNILAQSISILGWMSRNAEGTVQNFRADFAVRLSQKRTPIVPSTLDAASVKEILRAAYSDIQATELRILPNLKLWEAGTHPKMKLLDLLFTGASTPPLLSVADYKTMPLEIRRDYVQNGGIESVKSQIFPSLEELFPFYLAVLCQCSGNPMAIRLLTRNCVKPHPLRNDRARIIWDKARSGYEQKADFDTKRKYSAPNLIARLLVLNCQLARCAAASDSNFLFLGYSKYGISVPSWQTLHNLHADFIRRHDLPSYTLKDFRKVGAELHSTAAGTLLRAKLRLSHENLSSTRAYVSGEVLRETLDSKIAGAQAKLAELVLNDPVLTPIDDQLASNPRTPAETVFGFKCADPWSGAGGDFSGNPCLRFSGCATCPGAIIPLDDPKIVAKLLQTVEFLQKASTRAAEEGWMRRFNALYRGTLEILVQELLPKVSGPIMENARKITLPSQTFHLE